jgi:hypothetical protein
LGPSQKKAENAIMIERWGGLERPVRAFPTRIPRTAGIVYRAGLKEFVLLGTGCSPGRLSVGSPPAVEAAALAREAMEEGLERDLLFLWRCTAVILISPITLLAGIPALVLLISSGCVWLDSWSLQGAWENLSTGFPAALAIAALWFATSASHGWLAENRARFVMTTTGLLVGLILEFLTLTSQTGQFALADFRLGSYRTMFLCGALAVGCVNLVLLITARKRIDDLETPDAIETVTNTMPERDRAVPSPHFALGEGPRPVRLEPYRPPPDTRSRPRGNSGH